MSQQQHKFKRNDLIPYWEMCLDYRAVQYRKLKVKLPRKQDIIKRIEETDLLKLFCGILIEIEN